MIILEEPIVQKKVKTDKTDNKKKPLCKYGEKCYR